MLSEPSPVLDPNVDRVCAAVLGLLLPHRRAADPEVPATPDDFPRQRRQLARFVEAGEEIAFTLPAFPCKSPSPSKVLGHLPDAGERLSLGFLDALCARIGRLYEPGARIVVCSDGHIFGDLIGVPDPRIDSYADELAVVVRREGLRHLSLFDLRSVLGDLPHDEKRAAVHARYAPSLEELRAEVRRDETALALYRGITRFLAEDTTGFDGTRSALQRACRERAYGVIQRSRAWGRLVEEHHPHAVRLSIHPQPRGAGKFGIRLLEAEDLWTTPWHATAFRQADGSWRLMRRSEAEQRGRLVLHAGRPSHFEAA